MSTWSLLSSLRPHFPSIITPDNPNHTLTRALEHLGHRPALLNAAELQDEDVQLELLLSELVLDRLVDEKKEDQVRRQDEQQLINLFHYVSNELSVSNIDELIACVEKQRDLFSPCSKKLVLGSIKGSSQTWDRFESLWQRMNTEFEQRRVTLLTRLDATLKAFFWKKLEKNQSTLRPDQLEVKEQTRIGVAQVLALTRDELVLSDPRQRRIKQKRQQEQLAVSEQDRQQVPDVRRVRVGAVPDRGGRTQEMEAPAKEMPSWQTRKVDPQYERGRGGRGRGGGRGQQRGQGQQRQHGRVQGGGWQRHY